VANNNEQLMQFVDVCNSSHYFADYDLTISKFNTKQVKVLQANKKIIIKQGKYK